MRVQGLNVLITGGASGLGAATAERLASAGARVTIADLNETAGQALADQIGGQFVRTDVTDPGQCLAAVTTAAAAGGLHALVCCAGIVLAERMLGRDGAHDPARFQKVIAVNLTGTFQMMLYAAQTMAQNQPNEEGERGVIITTASIAAFDGQIGQVAYAASKAGVVGMTLPAARELARFGVRVMTIAPGIFDTAMMASLPAAARESLAAQVPFPSRLGRPAEYAALAQHIIENPMLNGEVIRLDGAIRMAPK